MPVIIFFGDWRALYILVTEGFSLASGLFVYSSVLI